MLQPRKRMVALTLLWLCVVDSVKGFDYINTSPRGRREDNKDVTTVLLVDNHGRSSFGRFLSVKPDLGLITSTARTFIQEGVTTEYATQVLGTTLDNGRLYAHLLTKTSRVVYDNDSPSKSHEHIKWNVNENNINSKNFVRNTDFISSNPSEVSYIVPTPTYLDSNSNEQSSRSPQQIIEDEILNESPSNNLRVPYVDKKENFFSQNNIKVFKINPQKDITQENVIIHKEGPQNSFNDNFNPAKVKPWDNLPTFTVRNEFSPSGYSFLGDLPDFEVKTERSKLTTPAERKAKLLFRAGLSKPNPKELKSITYTGFADFTTTVEDTVIVFTPHTTEVNQPKAVVTSISVEATIKPTTSLQEPPLATKIETFVSQEPPVETQTVLGHKLDMQTLLPTMVIDKTDRQRDGKSQTVEETMDFEAKSAVLANEQKEEQDKQTIVYSQDIVQPSETQPVMLSTPSDEDIAKIFAALQAQAKKATEPLSSTASTIFFNSELESTTPETPKTHSGATTIFFDDDFSFEPSSSEKETPSQTVEQKITTTTEEITSSQITTEKILETTEKSETTTIHKEDTTLETTTNENVLVTTPEINQNEIDTEYPKQKEIELGCTHGTQVVPTTVYKTLTYLTTFFLPVEESTSTSIKSNEVISTQITLETRGCDEEISPSSVPETTTDATRTTDPVEITTEPLTTTVKSEENDEEESISEEEEVIAQITTTERETTTPQEVTTERRHVTESDTETTEITTDDGDEVELIFKTLYTTYTYLTTYFGESTSSIASRIVVTTNVITSTLDPGAEATDPAFAGLLDKDESLASSYKSKTVSFDDIADIQPTRVVDIQSTSTYHPQEDDHDENDDEEGQVLQPTPHLDGVKTYYTTYTYFTTIFVDGETEISSRTEVYTNYVNPTAHDNTIISPTRTLDDESKNQIETPVDDDDDDDEEEEEELSLQDKLKQIKFTLTHNYNKTMNRKNSATAVPSLTSGDKDYVTLQRDKSTETTEENINNDILNLGDYETIATMVTDVRSSTSKGEKRIIDSMEKRNVLLDDQIVSESNNESEILPSPTLLLQTSYTTFTYFTTMYHGTTSSNVVSRLETVTNVVTQTLTPTNTLTLEDNSLPVTYFTTFTYWTTLYKDGITKVTSREETVSNIVTPDIKPTEAATIEVTPLVSQSIENAEIQSTSTSSLDVTIPTVEPIVPSHVGDNDLTTYYTTYTYYTTSYVGDETVLNSRLETVTNVLNNSADNSDNLIASSSSLNELVSSSVKVDETSKPTGLLSTIINTVENDGKTTILSTNVFGTHIDGLYAKVLESTSSVLTEAIAPSSVLSTENLKPTGVVSINQGKIVDADGVSTLLYTTQAIGTYIDNLYAQVIESTSSLTVDEDKKSSLGSYVPPPHRTGLVRLIAGSIIQNDTTTLYESKVLGTQIDGRYAQIIESTSSFIVGAKNSVNPSTVANDIAATPTKAPGDEIATTANISPSPVVIEGSISDSASTDDESSTEETSEDEEEEDSDSSRTKSRLTFQSKKRTFTPAIRPFASRQRPTFAPKRNKAASAATITRTDFTPTVTAVLASKPNRFGGRRSSSSPNVISPTASGSRRFSRPKSSSSAGAKRSSSRIQPTSTGFGSSSRRTGFRSSSGVPGRASSLFPGSSRFRVRPTASSGLNRSPSSKVITETALDGENDLTTQVTDSPTDSSSGEDLDVTLPVQTTTEPSARRSQNPLLRFRRPPLARPSPATRTSTPRTAKSSNLTKQTGKSVTTTTPKPKTTRTNSLLNRSRSNNLFPRRNLFTTTTTQSPEEDNSENDDLEEEGEEDAEEDTDYDSSLFNTQTANPPTSPSPRGGRSFNSVQIKPFFRKRSRRDTYSRFRRPSARSTTTTEAAYEDEVEAKSPASFRNRFQPSTNKYRGKQPTTQIQTTTSTSPSRKRISPSKPASNRSQFTLREKDAVSSRSNFQRRNSATLSRTTPRSRLRNQYITEPSVNNRRSTTSSRSSSRTRGRGNRRLYQNDQSINENVVIPKFDGTITVTHQIPTEVTIPVVNGKITEYKNIVTAKYSTEILRPNQYSTSLNPFGKEVKVLLNENTLIDNNGATLIKQYILNESPTTSVIFTPTLIRGRKTSFSHIIPSTAYQIEEVVNTIQPALAAQAPLANILLSQLLLGGGVQPQNPLLALQQPGAPATPSTEYKTRTTTYVTTVTSELQTVIPLTFRGKEILTTIVDSSVTVVTATEFLTDTIVTTPTVAVGFPPAAQLNTLLLPLLQQQLQQQQQQQLNLNNQLLQQQPLVPQTPANVFNLNEPAVPQALLNDNVDENDSNLAIDELEAEVYVEPVKRKRGHKNKKNKHTTAPVVEPSKETSVITLYVSGRTPGEFTTVLSTVTVGEEDGNRNKREVPVQPSVSRDDLVVSTLEYFDTYVMPGTKEIPLEASEIAYKETESLESIIGDVSKHLKTKTSYLFDSKPIKPSKKYKIKYVKASDEKKSSDDFLA